MKDDEDAITSLGLLAFTLGAQVNDDKPGNNEQVSTPSVGAATPSHSPPHNNSDLISWRSCSKCKGGGVEWDAKAIGKRLQSLRTTAKVTLREMADLMELSIGYISDLEHGRKSWNGARLVQYMTALEVAKARPTSDSTSA